MRSWSASRPTRTSRKKRKSISRNEQPFALALGGNLGPVEGNLRRAVAELAAALGPLGVAGLYRTRAITPDPQPPYLNTAVTGRTDLGAEALLALAKRLEREAGRRPGPRFTARPLDIDLLLLGDLILDRPGLTVPHPRLAERRFVLAPLAELAADWRVPPRGETVAELLARVGQEEDVERLAIIFPGFP
ncbi:MAG TPA: 2-amino-4-hydroxy-6-hydroxymethyldihydropteridine diphosphokinase [Thermoanaerobaculia bacterium]|nr:2-amino-4-hydroxy-6-hydroxymethyldihydropteridine diphosphokinase [Thermoanaerobaculia bacterium]